MRERRLFWDAEGKRRSRNPYQKSTCPWVDEKHTHRFLTEYILEERPRDWPRLLVQLRIVSPDYLKKVTASLLRSGGVKR